MRKRLWKQRLAQPSGREQAAESGGAVGPVIGDDIFRRYSQTPLKALNQLLSPTNLRRSGGGLVKIANDADGDAICCDTGGGGGRLLIHPAGLDANRSVSAVGRTGDQEMIARC